MAARPSCANRRHCTLGLIRKRPPTEVALLRSDTYKVEIAALVSNSRDGALEDCIAVLVNDAH
jgi:hypothetical protein